MQGWAESDAVELAAIAESGLPAGHHLVLCEAAVADDHPLVARLRAEGGAARVDAGRRRPLRQVAGARRAPRRARARDVGLDVGRALDELARRTLRRRSERGASGTDPDSTARFAAEYRKLVSLTDSRSIEVALVEQAVEDRGEEDVWALLDAIGAGRLAEALGRLRR